MTTSRKIIPGETIPLEIFAEVIKDRAHRLGAEVVKKGDLSTHRFEEIITASDDDLRTHQRGEKLTYADLDDMFTTEDM